MRQAVFLAAGRVEWQDATDPSIVEETDALVRPVAVATCDLDTVLVAGLRVRMFALLVPQYRTGSGWERVRATRTRCARALDARLTSCHRRNVRVRRSAPVARASRGG